MLIPESKMLEFEAEIQANIDAMSNAELAKTLGTQSSLFYPERHLLAVCCHRVGWYGLSDGYGDWNYPHCLTREGGVVPFSVRGLIKALEDLA